jgi:very-short-patch-repair endonuclease
MARHHDLEIARIAADQFHLVTVEQVLATGLSRRTIERRVARGEWRRASSTVLELPFGAMGLERSLMGAQLHQPTAIGSHRAAADQHGFPYLVGVRPEVTATYQDGYRNPFALVHRSADLFEEDIVTKGPLLLTSVARTAADLFACYRRARAERIVDDLLLSGRLDIADLAAVHDRYAGRGRPTTVAVREVIAARYGRDDIERSKLEIAYRELVRGTELADFVEQVPLPGWVDEPGRVDVAYPWARVVVELDGRRWHGHREQFERDRRRDNAAQLAGWIVLRFTWDQVIRRPEYVCSTVRRALHRAAA